MKNMLDQEPGAHSSAGTTRLSTVAFFVRVVYVFTWLLVVLALIAGAMLLLDDLALHRLIELPHAPVSAAPLLLVGTALLGFQVLTRPKPLDLFKALLVCSAFMLWGIDQMLPPGWWASTLGDVVITLFMIDLGWMIGSALSSLHRDSFIK